MATNFPASLDTLTNPTSSDSLSSPSHSAQHANVNDAVEAIETALLDGAPLHIDDANERVGVGNVSPSYKLDVTGDINATGDLRIGGTAVGAIQTYTPTWTATGGTPTIGNGTLTGKYTVINNWCAGAIYMQLGSTSSISGTSEWRWSLPVAAANSAIFHAFGAAVLVDSGTSGYRGVVLYVPTNTIGVYASDTAPTVGSSAPFTWAPANGDLISLSFAYEVA